jgi:hypothetical protein
LQEVVDQAQHFAALGQSGSRSNDSTQGFREGLDATERERKFLSITGILDYITFKSSFWACTGKCKADETVARIRR